MLKNFLWNLLVIRSLRIYHAVLLEPTQKLFNYKWLRTIIARTIPRRVLFMCSVHLVDPAELVVVASSIIPRWLNRFKNSIPIYSPSRSVRNHCTEFWMILFSLTTFNWNTSSFSRVPSPSCYCNLTSLLRSMKCTLAYLLFRFKSAMSYLIFL